MASEVTRIFPHNSCFIHSDPGFYSKNEVITIVVLGVLSLIFTAMALYGYLINPSWLIGAHILAAVTCMTWVTIGALVVIKLISPQKSDS